MLFAFMACLDPGDEIIIPEPAYANYMAFAISAGAVIKSVNANINDGFRLPPVEDFEALITPRTKGILICNPKKSNYPIYLTSKSENYNPKKIKPSNFLSLQKVKTTIPKNQTTQFISLQKVKTII